MLLAALVGLVCEPLYLEPNFSAANEASTKRMWQWRKQGHKDSTFADFNNKVEFAAPGLNSPFQGLMICNKYSSQIFKPARPAPSAYVVPLLRLENQRSNTSGHLHKVSSSALHQSSRCARAAARVPPATAPHGDPSRRRAGAAAHTASPPPPPLPIPAAAAAACRRRRCRRRVYSPPAPPP